MTPGPRFKDAFWGLCMNIKGICKTRYLISCHVRYSKGCVLWVLVFSFKLKQPPGS